MSALKLILTYSSRIVIRQWRRFVLPFLSLAITAVVLTLILLITEASTLFLQDQSRALLGGDVVIESAKPIVIDDFWAISGITPDDQSEQIAFTATLESGSTSAPFSVKAVDSAFPLYGEVKLQSGTFTGVEDNQIYLDTAGADKLGASLGSTVTFGRGTFTVAGIISAEPTSLFAGFRFFPQAIISQAGFVASSVDPELLRAEYSYAASFTSLSASATEQIITSEDSFPGSIDVDIAGRDQRGLQFGLQTVSNFLIVAVLVTAVLSAVNVYASTLYFVGAERRNLAVLLALGLKKRTLTGILGSALLYIVLLSCLLGILLGNVLFTYLSTYISSAYGIALPDPNFVLLSLVCLSLVFIIAAASFIPAVAKTLRLNPKQILIGTEEEAGQKSKIFSIAWVSLSTLLPLTVFAAFLLGNILQGILAILAIGILYIVVAVSFSLLLSFIYKRRSSYSFMIRSIVSQKKADGFFGIISFTSLFIALVAIGSLALIQLSLEKYLTNDLARTVPSTYVLDIQPSQQATLTTQFPELTLFENIRARIIDIDGLRIQDELSRPDSTLDRELGREYNLTARDTLLANEEITRGVWSAGKPGEISVDQDFAAQADIELGSRVTFSIQGFEISGTVTSFRQTDSRSGLPFFYFVLSPEDVAAFPAVFFGYSFADAAYQTELSRFVAREMPNISVLDTASLGQQVVTLVRTLLTLVFVITLPPLIIATLLIATLVVSSYESRRREGARLRALGATRAYVLRHYLIETISLTLISTVFSYVLSVIISFFVNTYYLKFDSKVFFDAELVIGLGLIVFSIGLIGLYLFKRDTMPLRELISYETNI